MTSTQSLKIMAKWDAGRFLNTVSYFEAIPVFSDLQRLLRGGASRQFTTDGGRSVGVVLVVGALSEIGQLVVQQLVKSGYRVRAAVADLSMTPFSVPANVEFVRVELESSSTDTERFWADGSSDARGAIDNCLSRRSASFIRSSFGHFNCGGNYLFADN